MARLVSLSHRTCTKFTLWLAALAAAAVAVQMELATMALPAAEQVVLRRAF
jgi:hypothetical protein